MILVCGLHVSCGLDNNQIKWHSYPHAKNVIMKIFIKAEEKDNRLPAALLLFICQCSLVWWVVCQYTGKLMSSWVTHHKNHKGRNFHPVVSTFSHYHMYTLYTNTNDAMTSWFVFTNAAVFTISYQQGIRPHILGHTELWQLLSTLRKVQKHLSSKTGRIPPRLTTSFSKVKSVALWF